MYNRGNLSDTHWPNTWQDAMKMLREPGYKDPTTYYICLSESLLQLGLDEERIQHVQDLWIKGHHPILLPEH